MSLNLIQGYSSPEEETEQDPEAQYYQNSSDEDDDQEEHERDHHSFSYKPLSQEPNPSSLLPSASHAFSQVSGPPQFLNNSVEVYGVPPRETEQQQASRYSVGRWRSNHRKVKKDKTLPAGAVVVAKPQLVGIHERVRSDIEGSQQPATPVAGTTQEGGKRVPTATNPNAEDAAELLRMCLQCGIPKTFSNAKGMVCPVCGDRPPTEAGQESKKKGSTIKDKEKNKRMKGQSSHASWKSETEMHLRQQFD